jgi:hypothetical protein
LRLFVFWRAKLLIGIIRSRNSFGKKLLKIAGAQSQLLKIIGLKSGKAQV